MKMNVVSTDPAIIDVEFDELENYDFSTIFEKRSKKNDYGRLHVESQRETVDNDDEFNDLQKNIIKPLLNDILSTLLSIEYLRYPIRDDNVWIKPSLYNKLNCTKVIDKAGFFMPWHLDNRWVVMSGIINVQDNSVSTWFSKSNTGYRNNGKDIDKSTVVHVAQSKKCTGTFWANTEQNWHCVPFCEQDRKIILVDLFMF